jgi:hypothetical protein
VCPLSCNIKDFKAGDVNYFLKLFREVIGVVTDICGHGFDFGGEEVFGGRVN